MDVDGVRSRKRPSPAADSFDEHDADGNEEDDDDYDFVESTPPRKKFRSMFDASPEPGEPMQVDESGRSCSSFFFFCQKKKKKTHCLRMPNALLLAEQAVLAADTDDEDL